MSTNGWGKGSVNNTNGWGAGAINNDIGWGDSQLKSWSGDTDIDGGTGIPVNTVAPVISGTTTLGSVLTTTNGTWTAKPAATFTYQWKRNGSNITGATNSTYTLVNDDGATNITCQVTATNDFGSASATSNTLAIPAFTDADAQAFITAAAITDPTQQSAINQLVTDLKGYGVWTKMKALYPFVGGTASSHKFNLKNPLDTNAAFRLVFNGGWTHSSNGALPNGTNTFADTFLTPNTALSVHNYSFSAYSRTNTSDGNKTVMGSGTGYTPMMALKIFNPTAFEAPNFGASAPSYTETTGLGFFTGVRTAINNAKVYRNGVLKVTNTTSATSTNLPTFKTIIGAFNQGGNIESYSNKQLAFASIGDGLTDTEAANFYTAVQTFQVTLGRSIGTQTVSDADAQAFVTNAGIVDQVEADAVNNLVIGLKADGLWSKMKAVYPFVGGTASSHKFNLKNPLDTDAAYRLVFNGGGTHSANGYQPNGTNGYADTKLTPNTVMNLNSQHYCIYKTSVQNATACEFGVIVGGASPPINLNGIQLFLKDGYGSVNDGLGVQFASTITAGSYILNRNNTNDKKLFRNGSLFDTKSAVALNNNLTNVFLGARNDVQNISWYSNTQTRFFSIGDGLTDTDATNLNTKVQAFQTALNRQV